MEQPLEKLKNKIFSKKSGAETTELTSIVDLARELGAIGDILGREFEVYDKEGKLAYTVKQKSMKLSLLNSLLKELIILKKIDADNQSKMFDGTNKGVPKRLK